MEPLRAREELQRKQQRWMAERQMALDRQDALGGVATTAAATAATTAVPAVKAKVDDYQLLDRVTTKITERLLLKHVDGQVLEVDATFSLYEMAPGEIYATGWFREVVPVQQQDGGGEGGDGGGGGGGGKGER